MASGVPTPSRKVSIPRALTVVQARICFRSVRSTAFAAPSSRVMPPTTVSQANQVSVPPRTGKNRASRKTPSLTMVAE